MRHLRFLNYYDAVARAGSIRKAAEQLNVTSSAVNRRIMDLEEELETPLFERRPRGVRLTAAGELFVHYVREQTSDLDRVRSQIEDLKGMRRGTVRIAANWALALSSCRVRSPLPCALSFVHFDVRVLDHIRAMTASPNTSRPRVGIPAALSFEFPSADVARTAAGGDVPGNHPLSATQCAVTIARAIRWRWPNLNRRPPIAGRVARHKLRSISLQSNFQFLHIW
jgi:DNA-binding transcriptional LysR family regulator